MITSRSLTKKKNARTIDSTEVAATDFRNGNFTLSDIGESERSTYYVGK